MEANVIYIESVTLFTAVCCNAEPELDLPIHIGAKIGALLKPRESWRIAIVSPAKSWVAVRRSSPNRASKW
jgi:hypothetical protein